MPLEILAFNYEYPPLGGGGGVVFKKIMQRLAECHHVTVVTSAFRGLDPYERFGGLEIHRVPVIWRRSLSTATMPSLVSYWPSSQWLGQKLLRTRRFDLINSHFVVPSGPSADWLSRRFRVPHVLSIHGGDIFDPSKKTSPHRVPIVHGLVRNLLSRADWVVAQSEDTWRNARRLYDIDRPISVIPLGFAPRPVERVSRADLGIGEDRFVIITLGRLVARKALQDLLVVLDELEDPRAFLIVVGDGPKRVELERTAKRLGLAPRVRFTGFVEEAEKARLLGAADVFASTSLHEGFGLAFLEAMDQELPIVAYDRGGHTDFLKDGRTGFLVPFGDRKAFVAALRTLRDSSALRRRYGSYNRKVASRFTIERCANRYEELFRRLLQQGSAAGVEVKNKTVYK